MIRNKAIGLQQWEKVTGSGAVSFNNASSSSTNANFSEPGIYVLRFTAFDNNSVADKGKFYEVSDEIVVTVGDGVDTTNPTVGLSTSETTVNSSFSVTVNFSEQVNGLSISDFSISNGTISSLSGSGQNYVIQVDPLSEGNISIQLPASQVQDGSGNPNDASNQLNINYIPEQTGGNCTSLSNLALNKSATQSSVVFGGTAVKANDGNINGDFNLASVSATDFENNPWWEIDLGAVYEIESVNIWNRTDNRVDRLSNYYVLISDVPFNSTNLNTVLNQNGVEQYYETNQAARPTVINTNRTGRYVRVQLNYTEHLTIAEVEIMGCAIDNGDNTRPTVNLSTLSTAVTGDFQVNTDFSEEVNGLSLNDFIVSNATLSNLNGSAANFTMTVSPINDGTVSISLPENAAFDPANNGNMESNSLVVNYTSGSTSNCASSYNLSLNQNALQSSVIYGATADKAVDGNFNGDFNAGSVIATNFENNPWWQIDLGTIKEIEEIRIWNRTDNRQDRLSNYYILISDEPFTSTDLNSALGQPNVDNYYESNQASSPTNRTIGRTGRYIRIQLNYSEHLTIAEVEVIGCDIDTPDTDRPTVSLSTTNTEVTTSFNVSINFNEPVNGLTLDDFFVTNGSVIELLGSDSNYSILVEPFNFGLVGVSLPENQAFDEAGNGNQLSNTVEVEYMDIPDTDRPTVSLSTTNTEVTTSFNVSINFNER